MAANRTPQWCDPSLVLGFRKWLQNIFEGEQTEVIVHGGTNDLDKKRDGVLWSGYQELSNRL